LNASQEAIEQQKRMLANIQNKKKNPTGHSDAPATVLPVSPLYVFQHYMYCNHLELVFFVLIKCMFRAVSDEQVALALHYELNKEEERARNGNTRSRARNQENSSRARQNQRARPKRGTQTQPAEKKCSIC